MLANGRINNGESLRDQHHLMIGLDALKTFARVLSEYSTTSLRVIFSIEIFTVVTKNLL